MSAALVLGMQSCFNYKIYQDSFVGRIQSTELQGLKEQDTPSGYLGRDDPWCLGQGVCKSLETGLVCEDSHVSFSLKPLI